jgi:phosphatidylinositol alpha-1,6-mannosyltransferase
MSCRLQGPDVPGFEARYRYLYPVLTPLIKRIWRRAGAVTAISAEQVVLAHRTMPGLPLVTIPNGVDTRLVRSHREGSWRNGPSRLSVSRG